MLETRSDPPELIFEKDIPPSERSGVRRRIPRRIKRNNSIYASFAVIFTLGCYVVMAPKVARLLDMVLPWHKELPLILFICAAVWLAIYKLLNAVSART